MTLTPTHRLRSLAPAVLALVLAASARTATAQTPPVFPGPAPVAPGQPVAPVAPAQPGTPPTAPTLPPGYAPPGAAAQAPPSWPTPAELPPGYAPPGYYPQGPYPGMQSVPLSDPYALPPLPPRRRHDTGLFVGGVLLVAGGMGIVLTGAYLVASAAERIDIYCDTPSFPCAHKTDAPRMTGGALLMTAGTLAAAAGIPMWFIGSQYVVVPKDEKKAALVPEVRVGAGSASMTFHF